MSIKLMAAAWELDIPSTEKMVLLCLCDFSNDAGVCWPSVPTIARKCSKGDRTVQAAIRWLRDQGFCSWDDAPGKPHMFRLNPRKICTPAETAPPQLSTQPPQNLHHTPANLAPKPSRTTNRTTKSIIRAQEPAQPEGVSDIVWRDFRQHRRDKGGPLTETALSGIEREAARAGWTLEAALVELMLRGWLGFKADWVKDKANGRQNDKRSGAARAIDSRLGFGEPAREAGRYATGDGPQGRPVTIALPAPDD